MIIPKKEYEKPQSGLYHGILADVVEVGMVTTVYQGQSKTYPAARFVWILEVLGNDQAKYPQTYGKNLSVSKRYNISNFHEKANIYKDLKMILGQPPDTNRDIETYIGTIRKIWINREKSPDGTKDFANIAGYLPSDPGFVILIPPDFVREKFRPKQTAGPQGQPVNTYQQPPQQLQAAAQYVPPQPPQQYAPEPAPQGADVKF